MNSNVKAPKPIIHIATDEKFIDTAYEIYEKAFPGRNRFLILIDKKGREINFLSKDNNYQFLVTDKNLKKDIHDLVKGSSLIVFHGMDYSQAKLAMSLANYKIKLMWTVFGFEVYNNYRIVGNTSYGNMTYKMFASSYRDWLREKVVQVYHLLVKRKIESNKSVVEAFMKMDFVGILYEEELEKYRELGIVNDSVKLINYSYYPLDLVINKDSNFVTSDNILVGNSASYTNNHIEVFNLLKDLPVGEQKIVTPLSYGKKKYANQISKIGKSYFGSNYIPITDFLPLKEYQEVLEDCGIVIMNHYRQQAIGNVLNALYLGAKVYLNKRNTLYHYLKRIGCLIYSIEDDLIQENQDVFKLLREEQMEKNRDILKVELSYDRIIKELQSKLEPLFTS